MKVGDIKWAIEYWNFGRGDEISVKQVKLLEPQQGMFSTRWSCIYLDGGTPRSIGENSLFDNKELANEEARKWCDSKIRYYQEMKRSFK